MRVLQENSQEILFAIAFFSSVAALHFLTGMIRTSQNRDEFAVVRRSPSEGYKYFTRLEAESLRPAGRKTR